MSVAVRITDVQKKIKYYFVDITVGMTGTYLQI